MFTLNSFFKIKNGLIVGILLSISACSDNNVQSSNNKSTVEGTEQPQKSLSQSTSFSSEFDKARDEHCSGIPQRNDMGYCREVIELSTTETSENISCLKTFNPLNDYTQYSNCTAAVKKAVERHYITNIKSLKGVSAPQSYMPELEKAHEEYCTDTLDENADFCTETMTLHLNTLLQKRDCKGNTACRNNLERQAETYYIENLKPLASTR